MSSRTDPVASSYAIQFVNVALATLAGCVLSAVLSGAITNPSWFAQRSVDGVWFAGESVAYFYVPMALYCGFVPGFLVMSLSRAREHPWRALPWLIAGATMGFVVPALWLQDDFVGSAAMFETPTVGLVIAGVIHHFATKVIEARQARSS